MYAKECSRMTFRKFDASLSQAGMTAQLISATTGVFLSLSPPIIPLIFTHDNGCMFGRKLLKAMEKEKNPHATVQDHGCRHGAKWPDVLSLGEADEGFRRIASPKAQG
ncbi:hypothetical protein JOB18_002909 [Solea senegalensis]|uniref:Uncharacterized protein n=1 Tax=Solea senegalensis TaxID=28829 RepID=A0AAV6S2A9_SOLSE|nr:hypothetical protein JOB18_002909 [Solea senegalensis]